MEKPDSETTALGALSDLYRRSNGTMRQCCYGNADSLCSRKGCHENGCYRANQILKGAAANAES